MGWLQRALRVREGKSVLLGAKVLVSLLVAYFVFAFLYVALSRMNYHFALEWLEGGYYDKYLEMDFRALAKRCGVREYGEDVREHCVVMTFRN